MSKRGNATSSTASSERAAFLLLHHNLPNHALGDDTLWLVLEEVDEIFGNAVLVGAWLVCGVVTDRDGV